MRTFFSRLKPVLLGLLGVAIGFLLYTVALDYWFLHTARVQNDEQKAISAAVAKIQAQQAATAAK
jgi:hypothetical protein